MDEAASNPIPVFRAAVPSFAPSRRTTEPATSSPAYLNRMGAELSSEQRDELEAAMQECASEPIRTPGEIQPHGALVVIDRSSRRVVSVSETAGELLGLSNGALLGERIGDVLGEDWSDFGRDATRAGERVRQWSLRDPAGDSRSEQSPEQLEVSGHASEQFVFLELQPASESNITAEDLADFLTSLGTFGQAGGLEALLGDAAVAIRKLVGYDRVMVYRFDETYSGTIIAEDRVSEIEPYLGLRYPASDIPEQARQLYLEQRVRILVDVDYIGCGLVQVDGDTSQSAEHFDLSGCALRSMSPIHRRYLANMGVAATLAISLVVDGRLWGLIACHHGSPRNLSFRSLRLAGSIGELLMMRINEVRTSETAAIRATRFRRHTDILQHVHDQSDVFLGLRERSDELRQLIDADGVALMFGDEIAAFGDVPPESTLRTLTSTVGENAGDQPFYTDALATALKSEPEIRQQLGPVAGVVGMEFWPCDYLLFFRNEKRYSVRWAGEPLKSVARDGDGRLQPRASFDAWTEDVAGTCSPWTDLDLETANDFRNALAVYIIRRAHELRELNERLKRKTSEVEQFVYSVSHDLKSPLVTMHGFLGLIREDLAKEPAPDLESVDDSLRRVEKAATSMNRFIDDLLSFSRIGRDEGVPLTEVDLGAIVHEAIEQRRPLLDDLGFTIRVDENLPRVPGRETDFRRVFDNLLSNAEKYAADVPEPQLEVSCRETALEFVVRFRDFGPGIPEEFHSKAMQLFQRLQPETAGSGVGLASVAKIVESLGGRTWLENPDDGGLCVAMALPRHGVRGGTDPTRTTGG